MIKLKPQFLYTLITVIFGLHLSPNVTLTLICRNYSLPTLNRELREEESPSYYQNTHDRTTHNTSEVVTLSPIENDFFPYELTRSFTFIFKKITYLLHSTVLGQSRHSSSKS